MSQENVEVVRSIFAAWERGDEAFLPFLDPEIEWHVRSDLPDSDIYRGLEGMERLTRTFDEVLDESWYSPREFLDIDDQVVVVLSWGGRGKTSGIAFEERGETWIFTLRDGKVIRIKEYSSKDEALEAAGLSE
jgi:ketosteroid isomerase-like protein